MNKQTCEKCLELALRVESLIGMQDMKGANIPIWTASKTLSALLERRIKELDSK